jgi:hypothetical protein
VAITAISRDWGVDPAIVRITDTTTLAAITTVGYGLTQAANIQALQNGTFQWLASDYVLIYYSNGEGFFTYDPIAGTFTAAPTAPGTLSNTLPSADIFVGNGANVATGVAMTGDVHITNAGVTAIQPLAVTGAKIANNTITLTQVSSAVRATVAVNLTASQINGMYATPVLILAAAGVNTVIVVEQVIIDMTFVSAQYANGGAISLEYGNAAHAVGPLASATLPAASLIAVAASGILSIGDAGSAIAGTTAQIENAALYISNDTAPFITGDSTARVYVSYYVQTVL